MFVARSRGDAGVATTHVIGALRSFGPALMVIQAKTMQQHLATQLLPARLGAVAAYLPARETSRADPASVLRSE